jgi:hypothetical protein
MKDKNKKVPSKIKARDKKEKMSEFNQSLDTILKFNPKENK